MPVRIVSGRLDQAAMTCAKSRGDDFDLSIAGYTLVQSREFPPNGLPVTEDAGLGVGFWALRQGSAAGVASPLQDPPARYVASAGRGTRLKT